MSQTAFYAVTTWIEQLLKQAPAIAPDIERSTDDRVENGTDAALRIYPNQADGQAAGVRGGFHRWAFDVTVDCYARAPLEGADKRDAEKAADALLQATWQRLAGAVAPGGVASVLERPRISWEFIQGDRLLACARLTFGVGVSSNNQTLAAWS